MAIQLVTGTDSIGQGFTKVNNNANEQIISATVSNGQFILNKYNGSYISVVLPIPASGGMVISPVGTIALGATSGVFNQVTISACDYLYDSNRYSIATPTVINLTNGDATYDRIDALVINTGTNTIIKVDGTAASTPALPTIISSYLLVGAVYVKANATSLLNYYRLIYTTFESQQQSIYINDNADVISNFEDLLDVSITGPLDGQVATYNTSLSKWVNSTPTEYTTGSGLTSSGDQFKLGGTLLENTALPLNNFYVEFQGPVKSTRIDANSNIKVEDTFEIYNDTNGKVDSIGFDDFPNIMSGTAGNSELVEFTYDGLLVSKNTGSLSLEFGMTMGSTMSFTQSFQTKSGIVALTSDIDALDLNPNITLNRIVIGSGTGLTESSEMVYDLVYKTSLLGGNSNYVQSTVILSTNPASYSIVGGGNNNNICSSSAKSSIMGGDGNTINFTSERSSISGGSSNTVKCSVDSGIIGGSFNTLCQSYCSGVILSCGGFIRNSTTSVIVGGSSNFICQTTTKSTIMGGQYNGHRCSNDSSILGGQYNKVKQSCRSSVVGGSTNHLYYWSVNSSILGGTDNTIYGGCKSSILGGNLNTICCWSHDASILGGVNNIISCSNQASIAGAYNCIKNSNQSTIMNGNHNRMTSTSGYSFIVGSYNSMTASTNSSIIGGALGTMSSSNEGSVIGGHSNILSSSSRSSIIGGCNNILSTSTDAMILGGSLNSMTASNKSSIIGGLTNSISGTSSSVVILGGTLHSLNNSCCSNIIGGISNTIGTSSNSLILGGLSNTICKSSINTLILGGAGNIITSVFGGTRDSMIIGGLTNSIYGAPYSSAVILGGNLNSIGGAGSNRFIIGGYDNNTDSSNSGVIGGERSCVMNSYNSLVIGGICNVLNISTSSLILGGIGMSFSNRVDTVIVPKLYITSGTIVNNGSECAGLTGTFSSPTTFVVINGIITSIS